MIAIARLFFDNVAHLQGSWLTTGKEVGQLSLHYGADDLGSIMLEENVVSSAGAKHRSNRTELIDLIRAAGPHPGPARHARTEHLVVHDDPANDPVDDRVVSHFSSIAIEGGTAHPELPLVAKLRPTRTPLPAAPSAGAAASHWRRVSRASLDKQPHEVATMFDGVAARYDLTNNVLSFGQDRLLAPGTSRRRSTLRPGRAGARPGRRHRRRRPSSCRRAGRLRRAARLLARHAARRRGAAPSCRSRPATRPPLPFADDSFDAVTISFGLRNVDDADAALRELRRVTRPGGRLVICEFSTPTWAPFRTVYPEYLMRALPRGGPRGLAPTRTPTSTSPSRSAPGPTSRRWPRCIGAAGWRGVAWRNLTGGIVALHRGTQPSESPPAHRLIPVQRPAPQPTRSAGRPPSHPGDRR